LVWAAAAAIDLFAAADTRVGAILFSLSRTHGVHLGDLLVLLGTTAAGCNDPATIPQVLIVLYKHRQQPIRELSPLTGALDRQPTRTPSRRSAGNGSMGAVNLGNATNLYSPMRQSSIWRTRTCYQRSSGGSTRPSDVPEEDLVQRRPRWSVIYALRQLRFHSVVLVGGEVLAN
jgi:hypothetical protein